ncbi:uncharacterized protein LOC108673335 isoform X2 [Hyalella azteca]|uniref:Uncharacterized protein LOC108673335 isoform X2 n=1 Tax=Hyalella azteca TaxID=294128 RepID=A0A8B7NSA4_HYAAZ|nr:uncharacterized protein LOC108673335 isoform X2 [Hyalella azteca]
MQICMERERILAVESNNLSAQQKMTSFYIKEEPKHEGKGMAVKEELICIDGIETGCCDLPTPPPPPCVSCKEESHTHEAHQGSTQDIDVQLEKQVGVPCKGEDSSGQGAQMAAPQRNMDEGMTDSGDESDYSIESEVAVPSPPPAVQRPDEDISVIEEPHASSRRRRKDKLVLLHEDEEELARWFEEHPIFYDKFHKGYKDKKTKDRLLAEKATTLKTPCTGEQIRTWLESMRTAYGKLVRAGPSGSAKPNPTEKEIWIMQAFSCVAPHISRMQGRAGAKIRKRKDSGESCYSVESGEESGTSRSSVSMGGPFKSYARRALSDLAPRPGSQEATVLEGLQSGMLQLQQRVDSLCQLEQDDLRNNQHQWADYLYSRARNLDEEGWIDLQEQSMELVAKIERQYRERKSKARLQMQLQQHQQQQPAAPIQQPYYFMPPPPSAPSQQQPTPQQPAPFSIAAPPPPSYYMNSPAKVWPTFAPSHVAPSQPQPVPAPSCIGPGRNSPSAQSSIADISFSSLFSTASPASPYQNLPTQSPLTSTPGARPSGSGSENV